MFSKAKRTIYHKRDTVAYGLNYSTEIYQVKTRNRATS